MWLKEASVLKEGPAVPLPQGVSSSTSSPQIYAVTTPSYVWYRVLWYSAPEFFAQDHLQADGENLYPIGMKIPFGPSFCCPPKRSYS